MNVLIRICIFLCFFCGMSQILAASLQKDNLQIDSTAKGCLQGRVIDIQTNEGLDWTQLQILELQYGAMAEESGAFFLDNLPQGCLTLFVSRIGYQDREIIVDIVPLDTLHLAIHLTAKPLTSPEIHITGERERNSKLTQDGITVEGPELQREMSSTIAESIESQPGVSVRAMGSAPSRPVIRGLGNDRLLVLEDGQRLGDLSETSADHAVTIDPLSSKTISIIRGPAALAFGSSVMAGVVNVGKLTRYQVDSHHISGSFLLSSATTNKLRSGAGDLSIPLGPLHFSLNGTLKESDDTRTPKGRLANTPIKTNSASIGVNSNREWGTTILSASLYESEYGIPGGFVGAHPNGVSISMDRRSFHSQLSRKVRSGLFNSVSAAYDYAWFHQTEYESDGSVGVEFGLLTDHLSVSTNLREHGPFKSGDFGLWFELRDYANGGFSFTPNTSEQAVAAYFREQAEVSGFNLDAAIRVDTRSIEPDTPDHDSRIGDIRQRDFSGWSGGFSASRKLSSALSTGLSLMKSFRSPRVEELFSEGPHLAAYSYEIGNPGLSAENGVGLEYFAAYSKPTLSLYGALFLNEFDHYIFPQSTGRMSYRRNDLEEYQVLGLDARLYGAEAQIRYICSSEWTTELSGSFVNGDNLVRHKPLSMIPPPSAVWSLIWTPTIPAEIRLTAVGAAEQSRVGEFEEPTASYLRWDTSLQIRKSWMSLQHLFTLKIENIFDSAYRNHLNRVKVVMPESGTNVRVVLQSSF